MYISLFFFLHMSVKGCEVSAVSWNFPRRHTNNTNCRSAVGAHRFIWHHRLQGQLEVINLQEGDSCVCVCVCVCVRDKWMKCTPPSYSHNTHTTQGPAPLCARPPFEVPPAAQRVNEEAAGGGRGPRNVLYVCVCVCVCDGDNMWKCGRTLLVYNYVDCQVISQRVWESEAQWICVIMRSVRSQLWSPWLQRGSWKMWSCSLTPPNTRTQSDITLVEVEVTDMYSTWVKILKGHSV